jgi:O-antigen/teichoic acid export membrane protein
MIFDFRSRALKRLKSILSDTLYRGSITLLANTVATAAIGFLFWTLAARTYPASALGVFSSVTSGVGLLATIAALGLPMTMIRHVVSAENQRELVIVAVAAIATVGTALCLAVTLALGPHLPPALHFQQHGRLALLVTALVVLTAISGTIDAGLVATRSSHVVLIRNLVASVVKVAALLMLVRFGSFGLLLSYGFGLVLSAVFSGVALGRQLRGRGKNFRPFLTLRSCLSFTSSTYLATIMGVLPLTVVPIEVLVVRSAAETGQFAVAFLIAGFLNLIPSTVSQVLFAETSRKGVPLGRQLRKALRGVYALLLPAQVVTILGAPLLLHIFGTAYATAATGCLRVLALSTLLTGGTYLVDSMLIARDRTAAYTFINGANAVLVLGGVGLLVRRGLTAAACGWALGQGLSLVLGLVVLATGRAGRHHQATIKASASARKAPEHPVDAPGSQGDFYPLEPQIRELLAVWPTMPTTLIAERIGWDQPIHVLSDLVTELRSAYSPPYRDIFQGRSLASETAQCGLWFPPTEIPVGYGQTRSAQQLPVLTMITGYSRWLSAVLIPTRHANDLLAGLWDLITALGSVPRLMSWDDNAAIGRQEAAQVRLTKESIDFCSSSGVHFGIGRPASTQTRGLIERAQAYMERSFLPNRTFESPRDFNVQLRAWLHTYNTRRRKPPNLSPAELIDTEKIVMLPLPPVTPPCGWHQRLTVGGYPFLFFDSNAYSVPPNVIGRQVELMANLNQLRILCAGRLIAMHGRSWAHEQTICHPEHFRSARRLNEEEM